MSEAERDLEAAKVALNEAVKRISNIVVNRCDGWNDFRDDYLNKLRASFPSLVAVRDAVDC